MVSGEVTPATLSALDRKFTRSIVPFVDAVEAVRLTELPVISETGEGKDIVQEADWQDAGIVNDVSVGSPHPQEFTA